MPDYGMEEFPESGGHAHNATRGPHWLEVVGKAHVLTDRVAATAAFAFLRSLSASFFALVSCLSLLPSAAAAAAAAVAAFASRCARSSATS